MKFENTEVWGFESAIKLLRATDDMEKSDSGWKGFCTESNDWVDESCSYDACLQCCEKIREFFVGENDLKLMQELIKTGGNCQKIREFMDKIFVSVDITAPLYWWQEVPGTGPITTDMLFKLTSTPITSDCFELSDFRDFKYEGDDWACNTSSFWERLIEHLESLRQKYYIETQEDRYKKELIRLLPSNWLLTRTVVMNYEKLLSLINQKHELEEWSVFMTWVKGLPYAKELLFME